MWIGIKENKPQKNCATKIYRKTAKIQHKKLQMSLKRPRL